LLEVPCFYKIPEDVGAVEDSTSTRRIVTPKKPEDFKIVLSYALYK
jgi:hypothetical protein